MKIPAYTSPEDISKKLLGVSFQGKIRIPRWKFNFKSPEFQCAEGRDNNLLTVQYTVAVNCVFNAFYRIARFGLNLPASCALNLLDKDLVEARRQLKMVYDIMIGDRITASQLFRTSHQQAEALPLLDAAFEELTGKNKAMQRFLNAFEKTGRGNIKDGRIVLESFLSARASLLNYVLSYLKNTGFSILIVKDPVAYLTIGARTLDAYLPFTILSFIAFGLAGSLLDRGSAASSKEEDVQTAKTCLELLDRYQPVFALLKVLALGNVLPLYNITSLGQWADSAVKASCELNEKGEKLLREFFERTVHDGAPDPSKAKDVVAFFKAAFDEDGESGIVLANRLIQEMVNLISAQQMLNVGHAEIIELHRPPFDPSIAPVLENVLILKDAYEYVPKDVDFGFVPTNDGTSAKKVTNPRKVSSPVRKDSVPSKETGACAEGELITDENGLVLFGNYPQPLILDDSLIRKLEARMTGSELKTAELKGQHYVGVRNRALTISWFLVSPIKWRVLHKENGRAFLLADRCLDSKVFSATGASYSDSGLRKWLNTEFLESAFTPEEKSRLLRVDDDLVSLPAREDLTNPAYGMHSSSEAVTISTFFARVRGPKPALGNGGYWTKTSSLIPGYVVCVIDQKDFEAVSSDDPFTYNDANSPEGRVRPCIWVKL